MLEAVPDITSEDLERESLDASEPVCDHVGTAKTVTIVCECGQRLLRERA